ncbi:hypothetical protein H8B02_36655 [Bradyrhizobium sp. Pear77]|uniref:hypothetical protein n=1 Tax=Bradyrhizobium altum TaxID=1571202 RepID=UPI001E3CD5BD|nr:hypothetical protein [Bradyrhizobium altum]MCC8958752.1 hypothetical protein [Bradyrhizobium altum]
MKASETSATASSGGEDAVIKNLQESVKNPRMILLDFIEQEIVECFQGSVREIRRRRANHLLILRCFPSRNEPKKPEFFVV